MLARMVDINGTPYMDGGIADSVPVRASESFGCEKNVVVLTRPAGYRKEPEKLTKVVALKYHKYPKMVEALRRRDDVYNETMDYIEEGVKKGTIFRIAPMGDLGIGRLEKDPVKLRKAYLEGYYITEGLGDKLKEFLAE